MFVFYKKKRFDSPVINVQVVVTGQSKRMHIIVQAFYDIIQLRIIYKEQTAEA